MGFRIITPRRIKKVKTKNSQEVLRRLEEYLKGSCDGQVEILCGFWKDQQDAITYQEIRQAVLDGTISQQTIDLWRQDYSMLVAGKLSSMWTDAISAGPTGQPILDGPVFEFNTQTPGIMNWLSNRGTEFVTACTQEQKDAVAALLTKKMRDGHTVDELSRLIRPCIGLTEGDAKAATRFYDNIVANLKIEHPRMKPESIRRKALDATQKYAERKHRQRAMTVAQTESAFAYNRGADEGIRQAQSQNLLGTVRKRWSTSGDDGVCDICNALEGVEIDMDSEFAFRGRQLFAGQHMLPPAHPRCACAVEYVEVEARASMGISDMDYQVSEMESIWEQKTEEEDLLRRVLNEYKRKIKITYDNMTRNDPPIALSALKGRHARNIKELIENSPEHYGKFIVSNADKIFFLKTDAVGNNRFSNGYNGIFINFSNDEHNTRGAYTSTFHEMGHNVDRILNNISRYGNFGSLLRADAQNFLIAYSKINGYNTEEALYKLSDAIQLATGRQSHIMSDLFSGIYGNKYDWKYKHLDDYWLKEGHLESEAFAHFFSASVLADAEKLETVKAVFPNAYHWFDELIQEAVRNG